LLFDYGFQPASHVNSISTNDASIGRGYLFGMGGAIQPIEAGVNCSASFINEQI